MGNLGWAEVAVIVVVALVVLGPDKLPGAARQIGNVIRQVRRISTGFQQELQNALDEPIEAEARRRGELAVEQSKTASEPAGEPATERTSVPANVPASEPATERTSVPAGEPANEPASDPPPSSQ